MQSHIRRHRPLLALSIVAVVVVSALSACGSSGSPSDSAQAGNGVDLALVQEMTPHHRSAVAMARIAQRRSDRPQVKMLADDIIRSQSDEIGLMQKLAGTMKAANVKAGDLGLPMQAMGMNMDTRALAAATPFDRAFIDMMLPHHQGAIRMARVELAKGSRADVKRLARGIIAAQSREITEMNAWRTRWYGAPSPAGGIPPAGK